MNLLFIVDFFLLLIDNKYEPNTNRGFASLRDVSKILKWTICVAAECAEARTAAISHCAGRCLEQ